MKRLLTGLAVLTILPLVFTGCTSVNTGPTTIRNYDLTGFSKIDVSSAFEVEIVQSSSWGISISAQEKLFDHINVTKNGDTLEINLKWNVGTVLSNWGYKRPKASIAMPEIDGFNLSGASRGSVKGFQSSRNTKIMVSGASTLEIDIEEADITLELSGASKISGSMKAATLTAIIDGASRANLTGSADKLVLNASGASSADMEGLSAQNVEVNLSGASRATVSPVTKLKVSVSGASSLTYTGNPSLDSVDVSGASTIHKK
jgi:hypothetical protein